MSKFWCPEQKLKLLSEYMDANTNLAEFVKSCYISEPTFRKWYKKWTREGFKGLCNQAEWEIRRDYITGVTNNTPEVKCKCNLDCRELVLKAKPKKVKI